MINIKKQQSTECPGTEFGIDGDFQALEQQGTIGEIGQLVIIFHVREVFLGTNFGGHIFEDRDPPNDVIFIIMQGGRREVDVRRLLAKRRRTQRILILFTKPTQYPLMQLQYRFIRPEMSQVGSDDITFVFTARHFEKIIVGILDEQIGIEMVYPHRCPLKQ